MTLRFHICAAGPLYPHTMSADCRTHRYVAMQPVISAEIMELHHKKHHQTYVNTFNTLTEQFGDAEQRGDVAKIIALGQGIKFNGGGAYLARWYRY